MFGKLKYWATGALMAPLALFAQEGSNPYEGVIDTTKAGDAADAVGQALSDLITGKIATNVLLIIGAGLLIFAIFMVVRWCLRGGKAASR